METHHLETFNHYRPLLFSIAYNMLGSVMDAEDMLQETYIRWQKVDAVIDSPKAYLTTIITNLCINQLQSARHQRETYLGPWLPEPLVAESPEQTAALGDALSMAFLLVLERLSPAERAVFLLRNVFEYDYGEIATMLNKSESACRQLFSRAQRQVRAARPAASLSSTEHQAMVEQFLQACLAGDLDALVALLAEDVVSHADGGGKVSAAIHPIYGADRVARYFIGLTRKLGGFITLRPVEVNGQPGLLATYNEKPFFVLTLEVINQRIQSVCVVVNPDKLAHLTNN